MKKEDITGEEIFKYISAYVAHYSFARAVHNVEVYFYRDSDPDCIYVGDKPSEYSCTIPISPHNIRDILSNYYPYIYQHMVEVTYQHKIAEQARERNSRREVKKDITPERKKAKTRAGIIRANRIKNKRR